MVLAVCTQRSVGLSLRQQTEQLFSYTPHQVLFGVCLQLVLQVLGVESLGPLQRLHQHLCSSLDLAARLYSQLSSGIAESAIKLEMQVSSTQGHLM
jgi:hypothetical protein